MPSPLAHLGAGYAVYRWYRPKLPQDCRKLWVIPLQTAAAASLALLPDVDVILAAAFRDMHKYHNNFTHSLVFGVFAALGCAGIFRWLYRSNFKLWFLVSLVSYQLHIIMDFFTASRGVMLFWPLSRERFASPVQLFYGVQWGLGWFTIAHLWTLLTESLFIVLLLTAVFTLEKRRDQGRDQGIDPFIENR